MKRMNKVNSKFINLFFPTVVLGAITGIITSLIVNIYKFLAKHIIHFTEYTYEHFFEKMWMFPIVLVLFLLTAWIMSKVYKKYPNIKGGGIPTAIASLRGIINLKWIENLFGVFTFSLTSFLFGVPLGNEGPSVQMGCAVGAGVSRLWQNKKKEKNRKAWERYSMTGGACAGFSVATGAPISGFVFAIEEAHRRISPMILISAATSVIFAGLTTEIVAPLLNISASLFPLIKMPKLTIRDVFIPAFVAMVLGLFAVLFLKLYSLLDKIYNIKFKRIPHYFKIFIVFFVSLVCGIISLDFISTGHELSLHMLENSIPLISLIAIVIIRSILTLSANTNGITGGVFLPLLAIGAAVSAIVANISIDFLNLDNSYYGLIIVLGLVCCISAMMKMPLTAVVFAVEALGCFENIVYIILAVIISYSITEILAVKSINDVVVEKREEQVRESGIMKTLYKKVTVRTNSFADGRDISDILWPHGMLVLSVDKEEAHGGSELNKGDVVELRCITNDEISMNDEIEAIFGEQ
ncbi:MAG: chloride channel protein [Clostridia bacterium]|nr:chloride channel protein [Clostridia bacterium]